MTEKDISQIEFDSDTVMHHSSNLFLTCKEFIKFTPSDRLGMCYTNYSEGIGLKREFLHGWPIDPRWEMVFSKCQRALEKKEEQRSSVVKQVIDVCPMKQEDVDQIVVTPATVFMFYKTEKLCHEIRSLSFPERSRLLTCYYMKPEERGVFASGWDHWYDKRGTTIYAKCIQLAYES